jgi:CRISPR/Cas system-associated exonuclease Cas4 (RecB family)
MKRAMRAKLSIEAPGVRGVLVFEGETPEVGRQLRQVVELLVPVGGAVSQPPTAPPTEDGASETKNADASETLPQSSEAANGAGTGGAGAPSLSHLSFSTLALLFRCAHAFHLRLAGIKPPPSEDLKIGTDFHAGIAAFLRGEGYVFEFPQNEVRFGHIRELLSALRSAPDLAVEPRAGLEAGGMEWVGYADAISGGTIYEFKATKRLPTTPTDGHALQASVYAAMFGAEKAKIIYVSEKEAREFAVAPFAGVREFLADMAMQIRAGVPNIPTGLTHPWGCDRCEYRTHCRFYDFVRGNGVTEIPF